MEEKPFYFSAIPYTPQELESALHREELPAPRRTVVSILGAMRGVGGMGEYEAGQTGLRRNGATADCAGEPDGL